jgi:mannitol-1-phosphate/altronate dehydrogenase
MVATFADCAVMCSFMLQSQWAAGTDGEAFRRYLGSKIHFHNTMVDRLTTHRGGDPAVPLTEPWPAKAIVIEDLDGVLDASAFRSLPGVLIRTKHGEIEKDYLTKFCLGNAINSAMVYLLAVSRRRTANRFQDFPVVERYLDLLFANDILPSLVARGIDEEEATQFYKEWIIRMKHPHFGLDNFWVAQNPMLRYYVRLFVSVTANVENDPKYHPSVFMAFATAVMLRYLTPTQAGVKNEDSDTTFEGTMDPFTNGC